MGSMPALPSDALPVCACRRATHAHGTRDMYGYHKCRCIPCSAANRDYYRATAHLTTRNNWVPAEPARRRVLLLKDAGLSVKAMAEMCGVSPSQLQFLIRGPKDRVVQRVYASTLAALNAITYRDVAAVELPPGTFVDAATTRRQLQALTAAGWSMAAVARAAGLYRGTLIDILNGTGTREAMRLRIDAAYDQLHGTPPPSATMHERSAAGAARARGAANGWTIYQVEDFTDLADAA
jgi:transcriptional regulator with XRE-family HTH domain